MSLFNTPWLRTATQRNTPTQRTGRHARTARRVALLALIDSQPDAALALQPLLLQTSQLEQVSSPTQAQLAAA